MRYTLTVKGQEVSIDQRRYPTVSERTMEVRVSNSSPDHRTFIRPVAKPLVPSFGSSIGGAGLCSAALSGECTLRILWE